MARCMWLGAVTVTTWSSRRKNAGDNGVMPLQGSCGPDWRHTGDTTTWNRLLPALRSLDQSESAFKRALTTHLFSTAQHHWDIFMIYGVCKDCVCVCQVCLLLLSCRSVIESGNMFIRVAMTLDVVCQYDIKDMMMGLLEPDHLITDADLTSLLTTARGRTWCLIALLRVWHRLGIDLVINRTSDQWLNLAGTSLQRL